MDNQYPRSKDLYALSGAATAKLNPFSITCSAYKSKVDVSEAE